MFNFDELIYESVIPDGKLVRFNILDANKLFKLFNITLFKYTSVIFVSIVLFDTSEAKTINGFVKVINKFGTDATYILLFISCLIVMLSTVISFVSLNNP